MSYCSVYLLSRIPVCCGNAFQHDGTRSAHVLSVTGQREIIFACDQMRCNSFSWYTNQPSNRIYSCVQFSFFFAQGCIRFNTGFFALGNIAAYPNLPLVFASTDMPRLTTGMGSEKRVVMRIGRCTNVIECTDTNLDSVAYYTPRLYGRAYCP